MLKKKEEFQKFLWIILIRNWVLHLFGTSQAQLSWTYSLEIKEILGYREIISGNDKEV